MLGAPVTAMLAGVVNGTIPAAPVALGQVLIIAAVGLLAVLVVRSTRAPSRVAVPAPAE